MVHFVLDKLNPPILQVDGQSPLHSLLSRPLTVTLTTEEVWTIVVMGGLMMVCDSVTPSSVHLPGNISGDPAWYHMYNLVPHIALVTGDCVPHTLGSRAPIQKSDVPFAITHHSVIPHSRWMESPSEACLAIWWPSPSIKCEGPRE